MTARFTIDLLQTAARSLVEDAPLPETAVRPASVSANLMAEPGAGTVAPVLPASVADLFVPDHYEANYAYPLIVWLADKSEPAGECARRMRRISDRNVFGAAIHPVDGESLEDRLATAVTGLRQRDHVHSERIFLAGVGEFGTLALQAGLARPEWFGGFIAIGSPCPKRTRLLSQFTALRGKRVFLATEESSPAEREATSRMQRLLWSAGMTVQACTFAAGEGIDRGVLREINRWVIAGIADAE